MVFFYVVKMTVLALPHWAYDLFTRNFRRHQEELTMKCRRKLRFSTIKQAERTAEIIATQRAGETGKVPVRVYRCDNCGQLHFSSKPRGSSTVAFLKIRPPTLPPPLPLPPPPPPLPEITTCDFCQKAIDNGRGVTFPGRKERYHRNCRKKALGSLPVAELLRIGAIWGIPICGLCGKHILKGPVSKLPGREEPYHRKCRDKAAPNLSAENQLRLLLKKLRQTAA